MSSNNFTSQARSIPDHLLKKKLTKHD